MMSEQKEVALPELDVTDAEKDRAKTDCCEHFRILGPRILCRERQLREALTQIAALTKQVEEAQESDEEDALRERMSKILTDTANELHGGPYKNGLWSWHDLAELAKALRERAEKSEEELAELKRLVGTGQYGVVFGKWRDSVSDLAALREGAKVTYRVEALFHSGWKIIHESVETLDAAEYTATAMRKNREARIVEETTITRERILDEKGEG
jgi:AcrR family transcriptional regulator